MEKIEITDPPGVAVDDDDRERNRGMIETNRDEQEVNFEIVKRMDSTKDGGKENSQRETQSQTDVSELLQVIGMIFMMVVRIWKIS